MGVQSDRPTQNLRIYLRFIVFIIFLDIPCLFVLRHLSLAKNNRNARHCGRQVKKTERELKLKSPKSKSQEQQGRWQNADKGKAKGNRRKTKENRKKKKKKKNKNRKPQGTDAVSRRRTDEKMHNQGANTFCWLNSCLGRQMTTLRRSETSNDTLQWRHFALSAQ